MASVAGLFPRSASAVAKKVALASYFFSVSRIRQTPTRGP
jgi:hypothetical protein